MSAGETAPRACRSDCQAQLYIHRSLNWYVPVAAAVLLVRVQVVPHPQFMQPHEESSSSSSSRLTYYLDGAHTPESMVTCAAWFAQVTPQRQQQPQQQYMRVLLFNCMKERDPALLLPELFKELQQRGAVPHLALFVPPDSQYAFLPTSKTQALVEAAHQDLSWQQQLQQVWQRCQGAAGTLAAGVPAGDRPALPALPQVPGEAQQPPSSTLSCAPAGASAWPI